jgi:hypothetical protein
VVKYALSPAAYVGQLVEFVGVVADPMRKMRNPVARELLVKDRGMFDGLR